MREVLLLSHSADPTSIINAKLVHGGVNYRNSEAWPSVWKNPIRRYPILCWSDEQKKILESKGFEETIFSIGSPYLHLLNYINTKQNLKWPETIPNSLLYFPSHSHPGYSTFSEHSMENLKEFYDQKEITVCLFWLDFIDPKIRGKYRRLGLNVTCAGYKGNVSIEIPWADDGGRTGHLPTLASLISKHEYVVTDLPSITLLYAAIQGKKVKYLKRKIELSGSANPTTTVALSQEPPIPVGDVPPGKWYDCGINNSLLDMSSKYLGMNAMNGFSDWIKNKASLRKKEISSAYVNNLENEIERIFGT